jgi:hypothetical protein
MKARKLTRMGREVGIQNKEKTEKDHLRFRLPAKMKSKIPEQMIKDGYGLREKSLWICDAIKQMTNDPFWKAMALEPINSIGKQADDGFYINSKDLLKLDNAATELVGYAEKEGRPINYSRTHIIRAAITWKFIERSA